MTLNLGLIREGSNYRKKIFSYNFVLVQFLWLKLPGPTPLTIFLGERGKKFWGRWSNSNCLTNKELCGEIVVLQKWHKGGEDLR